MKIENAKIENVTVGIDDRDRLSVRMRFMRGAIGCEWEFVLEDPVEVQRLKILMDYVGVYDVLELERKIIRVVNHDMLFRGFGHPIEDKFVPCVTSEVKEITDTEFQKELYNN